MWDNSIDWTNPCQTAISHAGMPLWQPSRPARARAQRKLPFSASTHPICPPAAGADANNFIAPRPGLQRCTCSLIAAESFQFTAQISKLPHLQTRGKEHTGCSHLELLFKVFHIWGLCALDPVYLSISLSRGDFMGTPGAHSLRVIKVGSNSQSQIHRFPHAHFKSGQELNTSTWSFY